MRRWCSRGRVRVTRDDEVGSGVVVSELGMVNGGVVSRARELRRDDRLGRTPSGLDGREGERNVETS